MVLHYRSEYNLNMKWTSSLFLYPDVPILVMDAETGSTDRLLSLQYAQPVTISQSNNGTEK